MSILVPVILFGWIPVVLALFLLLPPRRAVIAATLFAWLFLPMAGYTVPGLPDYTKSTATSYGILIGVVLFDAARLSAFRPKLVDLAMVAWCLVPMASSITSGLGVYDGASAMVHQTITWGLPYFVGRLYFSDLPSLRELAIGIFVSGLVYIPFCLYEVRMSPQLHAMVYGFAQHDFAQTIRYGGYRPMVFMQHGLAVGLWMCMATLAGFWLWRTKVIRAVWNVPMWALVGGLAVTAVLAKSAGALMLLAIGLGALMATRWLKTALPVVILIAIPPAYLGARILAGWNPEPVVEIIRSVDEERAGSFEFRTMMEDRLVDRSLQRPLFGWGGWGDFMQVRDEQGRVIVDSLWIIVLGQNGLVGLTAAFTILLMPAVLLLRRTRFKYWDHPAIAPASALTMIVLLFAMDCLANYMFNPVFVMTAGGLIGLSLARQRHPVTMPRRSRPRAASATS